MCFDVWPPPLGFFAIYQSFDVPPLFLGRDLALVFFDFEAGA
jgi:hypothetical protein